MFTAFILDAIEYLSRQSYQQFEIRLHLREYIHSRFYLRHCLVCMIHLAFQARPFPPDVDIELNFPFSTD